jgi:hypothetical protein
MDACMDVVTERFAEIYGREPVETTPEALAGMLGEPAPVR